MNFIIKALGLAAGVYAAAVFSYHFHNKEGNSFQDIFRDSRW